MTACWRVLAAKPNFQIMIGEWAKGALIALAMVWGRERDEPLFSCMNTVTGDQRNSFTSHLELCVRFWEQQMFNVTPFLLIESIKLM
jgi:hypothetical protein